MVDPDNEEEQFSDDPEEQLRMENEILKLKLNAELGGKFESLSEIPAEIENMFLKNVLAFEHEHSKATIQTVFDVLGKPEFKKPEDLDETELELELQGLEKLMEEKSIAVDYLVEYPSRLKYTFLTEELFQHESSMFSMPGMTTHYIYEEFHPNHEYDIRARTEDFFKDWFGQQFNEHSTELAKTFVLPNGSTLKNNQVINKAQWVFDCYTEFYDTQTSINTIQFTLLEDGTGTGISEGVASYYATLENNETVHFKGPFKFNFSMTDDYWQIDYFTWPGFAW